MNATALAPEGVSWPPFEPIPAGRILGGAPTASTILLDERPGYQLGLWQVTPGSFMTDHSGYVEYIHILGGSGKLVDESGVETALTAGVTVVMQPGWKGQWVVREAIRKVFTVIYV